MTDTTTTSDTAGAVPAAYLATIDNYIAMLNETDEAARRDLAVATWTEDGAFFDPLLEAKGHDELVAMVGGIHEQLHGQTFRRTSGVDTHNGLVRFGWELVAEDGTVTVAGIDIGIIAADGRLNRIAGFFGPLAELDG